MADLTREQQADYDRWARLNLTACGVCWERHAPRCPDCLNRVCPEHRHDCQKSTARGLAEWGTR